MPQLRQNIITGEWVVIAPERAKRPQDFVIPPSVKVSDKSKCPFCEGSEGYKQNEKVRRAATTNFYVIENKFPAFVEKESKTQLRSFYPEEGFYRARPAVGDHEVIIAKNHDENLIAFDSSKITEMLEVIQDRYIDMKNVEGVVSVMPIYNQGAEAAASIEHPHAQIFASGIVANNVGREMDGAERYYGINGVCVFCDIIKHEKKEKIRIVYENDNFIAITFFAARFPMETWILPKNHESEFENTPKSHMKSLGESLHCVLQKMEKNVKNIPLNFYIHSLPNTFENSASYHWHLEITPRLANYGGYELGSGVIIDIMSPEEAAEYLRKPAKKD
ncbi:MAG: galactose-1-phosphate uridylyltransferase [Patescibacteria group bacterium]|jgi:UDPglucose--hexose-1-phosphate uridylyltransferase